MSSFIAEIVAKIRRIPAKYLVIGVVILAVAIVGIQAMTRSAPPTEAVMSGTAHVKVATVAELASAEEPLPVTATIKSLDQATILAETSGQVTTLSRSLGDWVSAGDVIATFDNSSQEAAVLTAEGAYDAAKAALARVTGSSSQNTTIASQAALQSAYAALDDAVHVRADQLFVNPKSSPSLVITVPDNVLVNKLVNERPPLEATLAEARTLSNATASTVVDAGEQMVAAANEVLFFLDDLVKAVNETPVSVALPAATLSAYQVSLAAARAEVVAAISSITTAKIAYDANDVAAAEAAVKQAKGSLDAAKAALAKTVVRSSVSGTIVSLPVKRGDYVSVYSPVATVSNPGMLYANAQVTPSDAKTLRVGGAATIAGRIPGVITFVAPAIDPATAKIEVKVGIRGSTASLTDGETVTLALARSSTATVRAGTPITIPIVAAKIMPTGPAVFTVSASSTLVAQPITLGTILGDQIVVTDGIAVDTEIVTDARGLAAGQTVIVDTPAL